MSVYETLGGSVATGTRYEPYGPAVAWTYGNGLARAYDYDLDGRLTAASAKNGATALQSLAYSYDANDRISKITNAVNAGTTQNFQYDPLSRMKYFDTGYNDNWTYGFDANGNRTSATLGGKSSRTDTYTVSTVNNHLTGINGGQSTSYSHNAIGDIVSGGGNSYAYDGFNRMASVTRSGTTSSYAYNAFNERVWKSAGSNKVRFVYGPGSALLGERNESNGQWTNYLWFNGELVGLVKGSTRYFVHNDHLGRPESVTNTSKAVVWRANNYPFTRSVTTDSIGGLNIGLPGQYFDAESGNWYNLNRYYDSNTGRYLQSDPIGLAGGLNTYAYTFGNPISNVDPLGLESPQYSLGQTPMDVPWNQKADYIQVSISLYVFSGSLTLSRSGNLYGGVSISREYPNPVRGLGISANAGHLQKRCPTREEQAAAADKQVDGLSYSVTAHPAIIGGGYEYSPGSGGAVLIGFGAGYEVSPGGVSKPIVSTPFGW